MPYTLIPDLAARAAVPEQGTLSRVLHQDDRVRLVLFAFDAGQELTEHTASVPALLQVVSGRFRVSTGGDTFEMGPEAWLRLDPHQPHSLLALEPSRLLLTMLPGAAGSPRRRLTARGRVECRRQRPSGRRAVWTG